MALLGPRLDTRARRRIAAVLVVVVPLLAAPVHRAGGIATQSPGYAWADFNADGLGDVAIGAPGETIGSAVEAGAVHVLYGRPEGLRSHNAQIFHQDVKDVEGVPQTGDHFGAALAVGDFDADGFDDLAIGVPGERLGNTSDAGMVLVLRGSSGRLTTSGARALRQGTAGLGGTSEPGDLFGFALASGNFDADADTDLAVGAPGEAIGSVSQAGAVMVLEGNPVAGLFGQNHNFSENTAGIAGGAEKGDRFGFSLASGDFDGNGAGDLAIGAPYEGLDNNPEEGIVYVMLGEATTGLDANSTQPMDQGTIFETAEGNAYEHFGYALAAADFDPFDPRRVFDDLAIGVPGDLPANSGAVNVVHGTEHAFEFQATKWYQGKAASGGGAMSGSKESGDGFGSVLHANDFDGNGAADLAIGVPNEDVESHSDVGGVHLLFSDGNDLNPVTGPNVFITQGTKNIPGDNETGDMIGAAIASGDYDGSGTADLVIGVPGEDFGRLRDAGLAIVIHSGHIPFVLHQDSPKVAGKVEAGDGFGGAIG